jgi:hypothetical protein
MRKARAIPFWLFLRLFLLGAAGIVACVIAIERAHVRAAERAHLRADAAARAPEDRALEAPELEVKPDEPRP